MNGNPEECRLCGENEVKPYWFPVAAGFCLYTAPDSQFDKHCSHSLPPQIYGKVLHAIKNVKKKPNINHNLAELAGNERIKIKRRSQLVLLWNSLFLSKETETTDNHGKKSSD